MDRNLQFGFHNILKEDGKAKGTIWVQFGSEARSHNSAQMSVSSTADEIPLQSVSRFEGTLEHNMQLERVRQPGHTIIVDECRQRSIPGFPLESTINVQIGRPVSYADNDRRKKETVCLKTHQPIIQLKKANQTRADTSSDDDNLQIMSIDILLAKCLK